MPDFGMNDVSIFGLAGLVLFGAYTLFGITGFGQSVLAMPFLAMIASLRFFVPLVALLDGVFVIWNVLKFRHKANYRELLALLPTTIIGIVAGATILMIVPERTLLLALGVLLSSYGTYCLVHRNTPRTLSKLVALPLGIFAGMLTATFGTGGPVYVAYLSGRIKEKDVLRATILILLLCTTILRIGLFAAGGLYVDRHLWLWWLFLMPICFLGVKLGHYLHDRLNDKALLTVLYVTVVCAGAALIIKNV